MNRRHPATLRTGMAGFPVPNKPVLATLGTDPHIRMVERFHEVGDAFEWATANREPGELTVVHGHGKQWVYAEATSRRKDGGWKVRK